MSRPTKGLAALLLASLTLVLAGVAGFAQKNFLFTTPARPEVTVKLAAVVERDSKLLPLDKSIVIVPGEILDWTVNAENGGNGAAVDFKTVCHVPPGTEFVAGSAKAAGARAVFSIDGGKSYSPQPMIKEKQPDGSTKLVPAPVAMYTGLRYEWTEPLAPGGKLSASYKVRVK